MESQSKMRKRASYQGYADREGTNSGYGRREEGKKNETEMSLKLCTRVCFLYSCSSSLVLDGRPINATKRTVRIYANRIVVEGPRFLLLLFFFSSLLFQRRKDRVSALARENETRFSRLIILIDVRTLNQRAIRASRYLRRTFFLFIGKSFGLAGGVEGWALRKESTERKRSSAEGEKILKRVSRP